MSDDTVKVRSGLEGARELEFDVPDGDYLVNLLFMNTWTGSVSPG